MLQGEQGIEGDKGDSGNKGAQGDNGAKGNTGEEVTEYVTKHNIVLQCIILIV